RTTQKVITAPRNFTMPPSLLREVTSICKSPSPTCRKGGYEKNPGLGVVFLPIEPVILEDRDLPRHFPRVGPESAHPRKSQRLALAESVIVHCRPAIK